jgi:polyisoprenoid-binding protein YceI
MNGLIIAGYFRFLFVLVLVFAVSPGIAGTYEVDAGDTRILIHVARAGPLKAFGHNHLISTSAITGSAEYDGKDITRGTFHLSLPVLALVVDSPVLRAQEGDRYRATVAESARDATRKNMLGEHVLHAKRFPAITVVGSWRHGSPANAIVETKISMRGETRTMQVPAVVAIGDDRLVASGNFIVNQSEFGIAPFTAFARTIAVDDKITIDYRIAFKRTIK